MKSDLDRLMAERDIDAAVVSGRVTGNPIMYYMTNGARLHLHSVVVKPAGRPAVLACRPMEREEAAKSGLTTVSIAEFDPLRLQEEAGSVLGGMVLLYQKLLEQLEVGGRVAYYGELDQGKAFSFLKELQASTPGLSVVGEYEDSIFELAQLTKDRSEIERMREAGRRTAAAMQAAIEFVQSHWVKDEIVIKEDGCPLTVGDVKRAVLRKLFELELEDPEGMIFAIGRDAGVPHSAGNADDPLQLGEPIVFDLFPREAGGGYFHDMTRTFSLGHARPEVQETYDQVKLCCERVVSALEVDQLGRTYQNLACDIFEELGHETIRSNPQAESGYVHNLGHGVGLEIHSRPRLSGGEINTDRLVPGSVFSIEPGLYYPEKGYGVRLEDLWTVDESGQFHCLTEFPKELVVPMDART
jgi:Xaa-Pro aminopeptidase